MSKIVQAVNAMIENQQLITEVIKGADGELLFKYLGRHKWAISRDAGNYELSYYSSDLSLQEIAEIQPWDREKHCGVVSYTSKEIGTREALASFQELYTVVTEKAFGLADVLDEIISSAQ